MSGTLSSVFILNYKWTLFIDCIVNPRHFLNFLPQSQQKEYQQDLDDTRQAKEELAASAREAERKLKTMETDAMQLQEVTLLDCFHLSLVFILLV